MEKIEQTAMKNACALALREAEAQSTASHEDGRIGGRLKRSVGSVSSYSVRAQRWLHAAILSVAVACAPVAIAQPAPLSADPPPPPLPIEQMRAFGYTKEFAQRFALPEPEPGWEPRDGLLAVEFRVEPIPGPRGFYGCDFKLYIDGKLDIAFPEPGLSGSSALYGSRTHPFIARGKNEPDIPLPDRRAHGERQRAFGQLAAIATGDYVMGKRGGLISSSISEFVRDLFPGVSYVRVHDCTLALSPSGADENFNVWIKKSGGKDYTRTAERDPSDFYQFPLPPALIAKGRPWAEWVNRSNHFVHEKDARGRRERYGTLNRESAKSETDNKSTTGAER
ncbi:MAG: hypothetical protein U1E63_16065 [Burkholderiales bacterium]